MDAGWSVVDIAEAVRGGRLTARGAVSAALARIEAADGRLNAYQVVRADAALREADEVDARTDRPELPMAGVPVAIKDNVPVAGEPMRVGSACTPDTAQARDHETVRRLRAAGAVVVGITRVPELCVFGTTDSTFGITRNPWNLARTPGGSSGGSAAAVAAGTVPAAHGNDGMGSIRRSWQARAERFFDSYDVLITPTLARAPVEATAWASRGWFANVWSNSRYAPFAAPWNLAGWPAMSVPAGTDPQGQPVAVQLVARAGGEGRLLSVAAQLERLRPWSRVAPGFA